MKQLETEFGGRKVYYPTDIVYLASLNCKICCPDVCGAKRKARARNVQVSPPVKSLAIPAI
jgi:hypothetical protein